MFSDHNRNDDRIKQQEETHFEFLDRCSWESTAQIRVLISNCLSNYPEEHRSEIEARIQSRREFNSATFELLLHELLIRQGFFLEIHPELPNGSKKRPDYLAKDSKGIEFYVEAVLASQDNELSDSDIAIKQRVIDQLHNNSHPDFGVFIDSNGNPDSAPRGKQFVRQVIAWLNTLDYETLRDQLENREFDAIPSSEWNLNGWQINLKAYPFAKDARSKGHGLVATYNDGEATWVNSWTPLRNAIRMKGSRYGQLDKPLIVAVNFQSGYLNIIDEFQALYGQELVVISNDEASAKPTLKYDNNGAWNGRSGPEGTRVSGAWFFNNLLPYTASNAGQRLHLNPWADLSVPSSLLDFPHTYLENQQIQEVSGKTIAEIMDLPPNWPEPANLTDRVDV